MTHLFLQGRRIWRSPFFFPILVNDGLDAAVIPRYDDARLARLYCPFAQSRVPFPLRDSSAACQNGLETGEAAQLGQFRPLSLLELSARLFI